MLHSHSRRCTLYGTWERVGAYARRRCGSNGLGTAHAWQGGANSARGSCGAVAGGTVLGERPSILLPRVFTERPRGSYDNNYVVTYGGDIRGWHTGVTYGGDIREVARPELDLKSRRPRFRCHATHSACRKVAAARRICAFHPPGGCCVAHCRQQYGPYDSAWSGRQ